MRRLGGIVLLALTAALPACGDDDGGGAGGDGGAIATMLAAVPDTADLRSYVVVNDLAGARELSGLDPLENPDPDEVVDQLTELTLDADEVRPFIAEFVGGQSAEVEAWEEELGLNASQVDRDVTAGTPPEQLQVADGRFDPDAIDDAVADDPVWSDVLDEGEVDGTTVYSWLDDGEVDIERVSTTRRIGESARLAVLDDTRLAWARTDDVIEAAVATANGDESSLAERDDLGGLAAALDRAGTVSAVLSAEPDLGAGPPGDLEDYEAFATGGTEGEGGDPALVIALWHEDEDAAEENVDALEDLLTSDEAMADGRAWEDRVEVESVEREGQVVLAIATVDNPGLWFELTTLREPLVTVDIDD